MQHVPIRTVLGYSCFPAAGELLSDRPYPLVVVTLLGDLHSIVHVAAADVTVEPHGQRVQGNPGLDGEGGRSHRERRCLTEEVHAHSASTDVSIPHQRDEFPLPEFAGQFVENVRLSGGIEVHAEFGAVRHKRVEQFVWLDPFGHRRHRSVGGSRPRAGVIPVGHVWGDHQRTTGFQRSVKDLLTTEDECVGDALPRPGRQSKGLAPVAHVAAHSGAA